MNGRPLQLALREWRMHMRKPQTLVALIATGCVLGVAGPFETGEVMRFLPRCLYWCVTVIACYSFGFLVDASFRHRFGKVLSWVTLAVSGLLTGICVTSFVLTLNYVSFGHFPVGTDLIGFTITVMAISMIVTVATSYVSRRTELTQSETGKNEDGDAPIMDRLPFDKRGDLVALSVEDHYVRVQTHKGEELILLRLSDAMREVGSTIGEQVHRSHWVAFDQVQNVTRDGTRVFLEVSTGARIPVSRSNMTKLKEAGLLPSRS